MREIPLLFVVLFIGIMVPLVSGDCTSATDCGSCTSKQGSCVWCVLKDSLNETDSVCLDGNYRGSDISGVCNDFYWLQCTVRGNLFGTPYSYVVLLAILLFVVLVIIVIGVILCCKCCCLPKEEDDEFELKKKKRQSDTSPTTKKSSSEDYYHEERRKKLNECLVETETVLDLTKTDPIQFSQPAGPSTPPVSEPEPPEGTPPPDYGNRAASKIYNLTPLLIPSSETANSPSFPGYRPPQFNPHMEPDDRPSTPPPLEVNNNEFDTDLNDLEKTLREMQADLGTNR